MNNDERKDSDPQAETIGLPGRSRAPSEPPPNIPDYRFIKVIGRGAYGTVWLAEEPLAGVFRAVKVLHPPAVRSPDDQDSQKSTAHIDRELAGLHAYQTHTKEHPHLVRILKTGMCSVGAGAADGRARGQTLYYVMEIADHAGGPQPHRPEDYEPLTLATILKRHGRLPTSANAPLLSGGDPGGVQRSITNSLPPGAGVLDYASALLDAIDHLHQAGIHHRDVKPSNCLIVGGVLKLADLGLAAGDNTEPIGTSGYLTPEGTPDDLYALGKVIYQMTTGLAARDFPEWPGDLEPGTDSGLFTLRDLFSRMSHPMSGARLTTVREARRRLDGVPRAGLTRPGVTRRAVLLAVPGALASGMAAGGTGAYLWQRGNDPTSWIRGTAPYNGTSHGAGTAYGGKLFGLVRLHRPGDGLTLPGQQTVVRFMDIQTDLRNERLVVAGGFQIYNIGNPCAGDITALNGEIDQIWLIVGEGKDSCMVLMYHGEPGEEPGIRARFRRWIPLDEIAAAATPPVELPIYLVCSIRRTPGEAEVSWRDEGGRAFDKIKIGDLTYRLDPSP